MKVPCEKVNREKMYLSCIVHGIQIHELSKLRITNMEVNVLNNEETVDKNFLEQYKCLLCYKAPYDTFVYFYYNFPEYFKLYPPENSVQHVFNFKYPYEIKISFQDEKKKVKQLIFKITGFFPGRLITNIIKDDGLSFYNYGTSIEYVMTFEENEILVKAKEEYNKYKNYFN